jgi:addiction module HigA family antidote
MREYRAVRDKKRCPSHPGALIDDILLDVHRSKTEIANWLGISRQHLHDILAEKKPLSPQVSVRVAKAFGGSPESWLRMQAAYDAWHAQRTVDVSRIKPLVAA